MQYLGALGSALPVHAPGPVLHGQPQGLQVLLALPADGAQLLAGSAQHPPVLAVDALVDAGGQIRQRASDALRSAPEGPVPAHPQIQCETGCCALEHCTIYCPGPVLSFRPAPC